MKKQFLKISMIAVVALSLTSCAMVGTTAGAGLLYTEISDPAAVTSNTLGSKVGTSKATNILGWIVTGDASINTAAKNAGIKKVSHVDFKKKSILGIYATSEIVVYGE